MKTKKQYVVSTMSTSGRPWTEYVDGKNQAMEMVRNAIEHDNIVTVTLSKVVK